ncbi:MAG: helix-turn-helix domain-containing protein [Dehalococcoidia bacterium]|nr:helix-turn-helix domain-containing protein [Dehalococcoidia bacterium]
MNDRKFENGSVPDLLTVPEAAQLLRISRNLAYELVARQQLPSVRLGRVIRIPRTALEAWMGKQVTALSFDSIAPVRPEPPAGKEREGTPGDGASRTLPESRRRLRPTRPVKAGRRPRW